MEQAHATETHGHTNYFAIWIALMVILIGSLTTGLLPVTKPVVEVLLFTAAAVKAWLVLRNFMHLKAVTPWLYAIMGIPFVMALFMVFAFVPDIGLYVWRGPLSPPAAHGDAGHDAAAGGAHDAGAH